MNKNLFKKFSLITALAILTCSYPIKTSIAEAVIIGRDDRSKVTDTTIDPYSGICYIEAKMPDGKTLGGTAWLSCYKYTNVAVTAAHCVYNDEHGGLAKSVTVYPGRKGSYKPYDSAKSEEIYVSEDWESGTSESDFAVLELDSFFDDCYHFDIEDRDKYLDKKIRIAGFPLETKSQQRKLQMYKDNGFVDDYDDDLLYYSLDTESGQSGSPIIVKKNGEYVVVGMNVGHDDDETQNIGIRITDELEHVLAHAGSNVIEVKQ